jgi:hypothetical protein
MIWPMERTAGKLRTIDLLWFISKLLQSALEGREGSLQKAGLAGTGKPFPTLWMHWFVNEGAKPFHAIPSF